MRRINKDKRGGIWDHFGDFMLALALTLFGLMLIWGYKVHGQNLESMQGCGQITGSRGECKISCDINTEVEFENVGCKGKENKCCVLNDENIRDVMLPGGFGGNSAYSFDVLSIAADMSGISACTPEANADGTTDDKTWKCKPNIAYKIPINIEIQNTGTGDLDVVAVPVVVVSGNADTVKPIGTFTGDKLSVPGGQSGTLKVTVSINSGDSKTGNYLNIYPYAKCDTRQCKRTDEKLQGIVSRNIDTSIMIKFVPTTT
jgi:hypothetical protein